jgi:hypothetical protein
MGLIRGENCNSAGLAPVIPVIALEQARDSSPRQRENG